MRINSKLTTNSKSTSYKVTQQDKFKNVSN